MSEAAPDLDHTAVDELLPWYVNGTLDPGELARVRQHLDACEVCRENALLLSRVSAAINRPAATPILPPRRPEALLASLDRSAKAGSGRWSRPALAATAALAVTAGALLLWPGDDAGVPQPSSYETVTSVRQPTTMDYVMSVVFEADVGAEDRRRVLGELQAGHVRLDDASGVYQVNVTLEASSLEELTRFTSAVEARPEIKSARIVALQLPMRGTAAQDDR